MLRVLYCGMGGNRFQAERLFPIIKDLAMELTIISEWEPNPEFPEIVYINWNRDTWKNEYKKCDIAIAPQRLKEQPAKSNVKVTQYMACGLPVVASALDAYKPVIRHGHNGYLVEQDYGEPEHDSMWWVALDKLQSKSTRERFVRNSEGILKEYSCDAIVKRWLEFIHYKIFKLDEIEYDWDKRELKHV